MKDFQETYQFRSKPSSSPRSQIQLITSTFLTLEEWAVSNTITLPFNWTTAGEGTYAISANGTWTYWETEDYEPYDNTFIFGSVTVTSGVPEFPFGAALEIALVVVVIYVWRRKSRRKSGAPTKTFSRYQTGATLKYW